MVLMPAPPGPVAIPRRPGRPGVVGAPLRLLALAAFCRGALAGTLRLRASAASGSRQLPPGDVSVVDDFQDVVRKVGAKKAVKVADQLGGATVDIFEKAAAAAEEAITDPVGAIGAAADSFDETMQSPWLPTQGPTAMPQQGESESLDNLQGYAVAQATPPPAPFGGIYCRGGACQYRVPVSLTLMPTTMAPPELCRGLGCPPPPEDPVRLSFVKNCSHIMLGAGLRHDGGEDGAAPVTIGAVRSAFVAYCRALVPLEAAGCPAYGDVIMASLAPKVRDPSVGGVVEVCEHLYTFLGRMKQAEIDLRVTAAAFAGMHDPADDDPDAADKAKGAGPSGASLLAERQARQASGGAEGPCSARGQAWGRWWGKRFGGLRTDSAVSHSAAAMLQRARRGAAAESAVYDPNPGCDLVAGAEVTPATLTYYEILPGSPDGAVPPVEVRGDLFTHCRMQALEITQNGEQNTAMTVEMTRSWCGFQSVPAEGSDQAAHPEWDFRTCTGIAELLAFSLRSTLRAPEPVTALDLCKRVFLASGAIHRVDHIMQQAWNIGGRGAPAGGMQPPAEDDPEQLKLVEEAMRFARMIYAKLKEERLAKKAVARARAAIAAVGGLDGGQVETL